MESETYNRKDRVKAKEQVLQAWRTRRLEQSSRSSTNNSKTSFSAIATNNVANANHPVSICTLLQRSVLQVWSDFMDHRRWEEKERKRKSNHSIASSSQSTFPSVLSILQANELVRQVDTLRSLSEDPSQAIESNDISSQQQQQQQTLLSILPVGYNWHQALDKMTKSRARAFWLFDVAALIKLTVSWHHQYHRNVQFLYSVQSNGDPLLLRLLSQQPAVHLVVTTKWDLKRLLPEDTTTSVYDNCAVTGTPDGYIREWIRRQHESVCLAVNGPDEVIRIRKCVQRLAKRWKDSVNVTMSYMIRLEYHPIEDPLHQRWAQNVNEILQVLDSNERIDGISFDVKHLVEGDEENSESLFDAVENVLDQLSHKDGVTPRLRLDVTGLGCAPFPDAIVQFWNRVLDERQTVGNVTVDATQALMTPAGALCTKVIGVREVTSSSSKTDPSPTPFVGAETHRHYYIDDGCYGALYSCAEDTSLCPLPLYSLSDSEANNDLKLSTVWGPTCDGLDRVCRDIPLPTLHRDDWLVFPNVGSNSEGLGTAFNGFDPPDTAYCVLDYFQDRKLR